MEIVGDRELRIHLTPPDPLFFQLIASTFCGIVKEGCDSIPKRPLDAQITGCGPFRLKDAQQGGTYRFDANPGFPRVTGAAGLEITVIESDREVLSRAAAGDFNLLRVRGNLLPEVMTGEYPDLHLRPAYTRLHLVDHPAETLVYLLVNWETPRLKMINKSERQAWLQRVSDALDRRRIAQTVYLSTATTAYVAVSKNETRPAAAKAVKGDLEFEMLVPNVGELQQLSEHLREQFRGANIKAGVRLLGVGEFISRLLGHDYEVALLWLESNVPVPALAWSTFFEPDSGVALFGAPMLQVGEGVRSARSLVDSDARDRALNGVLEMINNQQDRWVPIVRRRALFLAGEAIVDCGIDLNGNPHFSLLKVAPKGSDSR